MRTNWNSSGMYPWSPATWKVKLLVVICGIAIVTGVSLIVHYHSITSGRIRVGDSIIAEIIHRERLLQFTDETGGVRLSIILGGENSDDFKFQDYELYNVSDNNACLSWPQHSVNFCIRQRRRPVTSQTLDASCFDISWSFISSKSPEDCMMFGVESSHGQPVWYDTMNYVIWPRLQGSACHRACHDYVPTAIRAVDVGGTVVEPLWVSSQGTVLRASLKNPVKTCMELCRDATLSKLCLKSEDNRLANNMSQLAYSVCFGSNLTELRSYVINHIVKPESEILTKQSTYLSTKSIEKKCSHLLHTPLWNIATDKQNYENETTIVEDYQHLSRIGGSVYFSDLYSVYDKIGDFKLKETAQLNMSTVLSAMHKMNFSVMLPVSPFVNFDANNFESVADNQMLLQSEYEKSPILINAMNLNNSTLFPGILDFSNPKSSAWFVTNAKKFMLANGIDYLQLMYGQASWIPKHFIAHNISSNPGLHSTLYTNTADLISSCPLTDIAYASQNKHQVVLLKPASGLEDTLRMSLASGLAGYPFFIPNLPFRLNEVGMLSSEMLTDGFIRWIQLVSFFPVVHIPWDFKVMKDRNLEPRRLLSMVEKFMAIRNENIVSEAIKEAFSRSEHDRSLFLSPMWMAPGLSGHTGSDFVTEQIFLIADQFMIGSDLIFAPILDMNSRSRDVFFPPGVWHQLGSNQQVFTSNGKLWQRNLHVPLDDTLIFFRANA